MYPNLPTQVNRGFKVTNNRAAGVLGEFAGGALRGATLPGDFRQQRNRSSRLYGVILDPHRR